MPDEKREELRRSCHELVNSLRKDPSVSEGVFRLLEMFLSRLDRLETGSFPDTERPTEPERRASSGGWKNEEVLKALEEGKKES